MTNASPITHHPAIGGDEVRCACGSDRCVPAGPGVWVPLTEVDADEVERARRYLTRPSLMAHLRAAFDPDVLLVADRDDGEASWLYVPFVQ